MSGVLGTGAWTVPANRHAFTVATALDPEHREQMLRDFPNSKLVFEIDAEPPVVLIATEMFRWRDSYEVLGLGLGRSWSPNEPEAAAFGGTNMVELSRLKPNATTMAPVIAHLAR